MRNILLSVIVTTMVGMPCVLFAQDPQQQQSTTELQRQLERLRESVAQSKMQNPTDATIRAPITPGVAAGGGQAASPTITPPGVLPVPGGSLNAPGQPSIADQANVQAAQQIPQGLDPALLAQVQQPLQAPLPLQQAQPTTVGPDTIGLSEEAFLNMTKQSLPLSPEQVRTLKEMFVRVQRAAAEDPFVPPKPTSTSKTVDLSPGATPPMVRLQAGFVTSVVFLDASGAPWPIQAYDLGDPKSFNIQWDKKTNTNTLLVQAITSYKTGNLAVMLRDLPTPIMVTLLPGQKAVDYRVDLRMPGIGPNATTFVSSLPGKESPLLLEVLNGIPPQGSATLKISGCSDCKAWVYNGHIYFRSRMAVLSPAWISTISSADGMHAYEMQSTPVILVADKGKMNTLTLEGF